MTTTSHDDDVAYDDMYVVMYVDTDGMWYLPTPLKYLHSAAAIHDVWVVCVSIDEGSHIDVRRGHTTWTRGTP